MGDVAEAMFRGHSVRPLLDARSLKFHSHPAASAGEMVVVLGSAHPVQRLAVAVAHDVDFASIGHRLQRPVDRRETNLVTGLREVLVHLLGADESVRPLEAFP